MGPPWSFSTTYRHLSPPLIRCSFSRKDTRGFSCFIPTWRPPSASSRMRRSPAARPGADKHHRLLVAYPATSARDPCQRRSLSAAARCLPRRSCLDSSARLLDHAGSVLRTADLTLELSGSPRWTPPSPPQLAADRDRLWYIWEALPST
jgi:hypothetical protein